MPNGPGRIVITVPSMEGWHEVVQLLRRSGAEIVESRTFAIEGQIGALQAVALMELAVKVVVVSEASLGCGRRAQAAAGSRSC